MSKIKTYLVDREDDVLAINDNGSLNVEAASLPLPAGAATEAKQDEVIANQTDGTQKTQITDGTDDVAVTADNNLQVTDGGSSLEIAAGNVTGKSFIHKFGSAPDFDTGDGEVTVWDGADDGNINQMAYQYSTTADIDSVSSSNAGDAQGIEIQGLDATYTLTTQVVTLNGQTRVALTTNLLRVFRIINRGTTDFAGHIYCYVNGAITAGVPDDATTVRAVVQASNNETLMAVYTVPALKTAYLRKWYASIAGANRTSNYEIKLKARPVGQVFQLKHLNAISDNGSSNIQHDYTEPESFNEQTDIEVTTEALAVGVTDASISAGFDLVLVDNAAAWTPSQITTAAWYDASDADTITESGGSVSNWGDKSGNGRDAAQETGTKQPTTDSVTIGGVNAISFDGTDDYLKTGNWWTPSQNWQFCCVIEPTNLDGDAVMGSIALEIGYILRQYSYGVLYYAGDNTIIPSGITTNPHMIGCTYDGANLDGYLDGNTGSSPAVALPSTLSPITIGIHANEFSSPWDGKIGEIVWCTDITDATRQKIEGYLAWKWGTVASLPADHPYKNTRPTV